MKGTGIQNCVLSLITNESSLEPQLLNMDEAPHYFDDLKQARCGPLHGIMKNRTRTAKVNFVRLHETCGQVPGDPAGSWRQLALDVVRTASDILIWKSQMPQRIVSLYIPLWQSSPRPLERSCVKERERVRTLFCMFE